MKTFNEIICIAVSAVCLENRKDLKKYLQYIIKSAIIILIVLMKGWKFDFRSFVFVGIFKINNSFCLMEEAYEK